ncbi:MAG TPA: PadR family transcriptional regulator [Verrucomicrobiae bacterium]|nr:PadR family transcriptional regulator [Verrucomicrobiae bacterium]
MENKINNLVAEWDDVYKKGQLSLWILLAIFEGRKYAAQISEFMQDATGGNFEVKEQSLYRALRRFSAMGLVAIIMQDSPHGGPKRKYYELTTEGKEVLGRFIALNITPMLSPPINQLLKTAAWSENHESTEQTTT